MSILCVTQCYTRVLMNAFCVARILHSILMNITFFVSQECCSREHNILRVRRKCYTHVLMKIFCVSEMLHTCIYEDILCHMNATRVF